MTLSFSKVQAGGGKLASWNTYLVKHVPWQFDEVYNVCTPAYLTDPFICKSAWLFCMLNTEPHSRFILTKQELTISLEPQLIAYNICIWFIPTVVTHSSPRFVDTDLHSTSIWCRPSNKSDTTSCAVSTCCTDSCIIIEKRGYCWIAALKNIVNIKWTLCTKIW